jgi:PhnB protein
MALQLFINFNGNCREAVEYYAKVFQTEKPVFMTYKDAPPSPGIELDEKDRDLIMYSNLIISGSNVMFSDIPSGTPFVLGSNISLTIVDKDQIELKRIFNALSEGGEVDMELQETFWSGLYGMVTDKFGIAWQVSHDSGKEYGNTGK